MWKNICEKFRFHLLKESKIDGRWILLFFVFVLFSFIVISSFFRSYHVFWNTIIPGIWPPFADTRVITAGYECSLLGYNVFLSNPCNYITVNYPHIWITLASLGNLNQNSTIPIGIFLSFSFFSSFFLSISRINMLEVFIYSSLFYSPSILLALERGNSDLIIFTLLATTMVLIRNSAYMKRLVGYVIILLASILKLYPVFAFISVFKERKKMALPLFLLLGIFFAIYCGFIFKDIQVINQITPRPTYFGYGIVVLPELLGSYLLPYYPAPFSNIKFFIKLFPQLRLVLAVGIFIFISCSMYIFIRKYNTFFSHLFHSHISHDHMESFRIGASIYIGTFLLGNNYDYRLIFLLFTIPQLISWIKKDENIGLSCCALFGIIGTTWLSKWSFFYIDELINWFLFIYFLCMLVSTLPEWLKSELRFYSSRIGNIKIR